MPLSDSVSMCCVSDLQTQTPENTTQYLKDEIWPFETFLADLDSRFTSPLGSIGVVALLQERVLYHFIKNEIRLSKSVKIT